MSDPALPVPLFERVALIGVGLIGSSLARLIKRDGLAGHVVGCAKSQASLDTVTELGIVDSTSDDPAQAAAGADLVVICTPVGVCGDIARQLAPGLAAGAIVSDVGSVKQAVIDAVAPHMPEGVHFVPAHPVAGTEHSGPEAGFASLFENHWCILTPTPGCDEAAVDKVAEFWRRAGSNVEIMDAKHHDLVLAVTSHLPHLIAYNIVGTADDLGSVSGSEVVKYAGGGFHDFTRIAASDPVMWRDVFLNNREAVLEMLGRFSEDLTAVQRAIRRGEGDTLHEIFTRARELRRGVIAAKQA